MSGTQEAAAIDPQDVKNLIKVVGYEITKDLGDVFLVQDESKIPIWCCVQDNIVVNTIPCVTLDSAKLSAGVMRSMMDASNGLTTSSFRLNDLGDGKVQVVLTNFCKLLELEEDDADDIWSALNFLEIDLIKARDLLKDVI